MLSQLRLTTSLHCLDNPVLYTDIVGQTFPNPLATLTIQILSCASTLCQYTAKSHSSLRKEVNGMVIEKHKLECMEDRLEKMSKKMSTLLKEEDWKHPFFPHKMSLSQSSAFEMLFGALFWEFLSTPSNQASVQQANF